MNQLKKAQYPKGKDRKKPNPLCSLCYHEASWLVSCTRHPHPLALGHLRTPRKPFNGNTHPYITFKYLCQYALAEIFNIFHALIIRYGACCTKCQDWSKYSHNHDTWDRKDKGQNLTFILSGQCISLFPNFICMEDIGGDVDIGRGDTGDVTGDSDSRASAVANAVVANAIAIIWSRLRTHRSSRRGYWRKRRRQACASAAEKKHHHEHSASELSIFPQGCLMPGAIWCHPGLQHGVEHWKVRCAQVQHKQLHFEGKAKFLEVIVKDSTQQEKMWDQTLKRATHPSSKIYTYLWKSSPDYTSVFPNAFQIRHTEAPLLWRLELLAAPQSSQVSLHTLIYRPRAAKCGQPSRHSLAHHPHHFNQPNFSPWYDRASTMALKRLFTSQWNILCKVAKKCNWNQHHCQSPNNLGHRFWKMAWQLPATWNDYRTQKSSYSLSLKHRHKTMNF